MGARDIPAVNLFDLTGAFDVIEHIADDEAVLRNLRAVRRDHRRGLSASLPVEPCR